jgi:nucleotide-binding universal stress UspA family protein
LIATNGSRSSRRAVEVGVDLAAVTGAEVIAVCVVPTTDRRLGTLEVGPLRHLQDHHVSPVISEPSLREVELLADEKGVRCLPQLIASSRPAEAIAHEALSQHASIVVMGSGRRGSFRTARKVLRQSHCSVLLVDSDNGGPA